MARSRIRPRVAVATLGLATVLLAFTLVPLRRWLLQISTSGRGGATVELAEAMRRNAHGAPHQIARTAQVADLRRFLLEELGGGSAWLKGYVATAEHIRGPRGYRRLIELLRALEEEPLPVMRAMFDSFESIHVKTALVLAAGDLRLSESVGWLESLVASAYQSRSKTLFSACCSSLGQLRNEASFAALTRFLSGYEEDLLWQEPLHAAVGLYGDAALAPLLEVSRRALADGRALLDTSHLALGSLRNLNDLRGLRWIATEDPEPWVRAMATHAVGRAAAPSSLAILMERIRQDPSSRVALAALGVLDSCGDATTFDFLVERLGADPEPEWGRAAVGPLVALGGARAIPVLIHLSETELGRAQDAGLHEAVLGVLASCEDPRAADHLITLWEAGNRELRSRVLRAITRGAAHASGARLEGPLADVLENPGDWSPEEVRAAVRAYGWAGGGGCPATGRIVRLLLDAQEEPYRRQIIQALHVFDDERIDAAVTALLDRTDNLLTRVFAYEFLNGRVAEAALPPQFRASEYETAQQVLAALERFELSQFMLASPWGQVENGSALVSFLGRVGKPQDIPALEMLRSRHAGALGGAALSNAIAYVVIPIRARAELGR